MSKVINTVGGGGSGGSSWEVVWTNPNPSTQNFTAQTLDVDLSNYSEWKVLFRTNAASETNIGSTESYATGANMKITRFWGSKAVERNFFNEPATRIEIEGGKISNSYGGAQTDANQYIIPVIIYAR